MMKLTNILMVVLVVVPATASAARLADLQGMSAAVVAGLKAEIPAASAGEPASPAQQTPLSGWLDGKHHDHYAPDPKGTGLNYVLYATLVKSDGILYLQAFAPGRGNLDYLANFLTTPEYVLADIGVLRSDQGNPYVVAFENYSATTPRTNMLVVEFDGGRTRFAIVQKFPTSDIRDGKFKPYVPSDADAKAWSPWMAVR